MTGVVVSLLSWCFTFDMYRDVANVYAYYAREIAEHGLEAGWVGRVPMLHILLSGGVVKLGMEAYRAAVLVSCVFYFLTLFPLRRLLERFVTPLQAAWGALLFVTAPKVIRFSTTGLLDSERLFFLVTSLLFFFRLAEGKKRKDAVLLGAFLALLSVSRGECIVAAVAALSGFPVFALWKHWSGRCREWKRIIEVTVIASIIFIGVLSPFCYGNYLYAGAFVPDMRMSALFQQPDAAAATAAETESSVSVPRLADGIVTALGNTLRGAYEPYLFLALLGMAVLIQRKKWKQEHTLLVGVYFLHTLIYINFIQAYRYFVYLVPLFLPFTVTGVFFLADQFRRLPEMRLSFAVKYLAVAGISVGFIAQIVNGLDFSFRRKDAGLRETAGWLRSYAAEHFAGDRVRVASDCLFPEIIYWSGASAVINYKEGNEETDLKTFRDFDLLMIARENAGWVREFPELVPVETPSEYPVVFFRKAEIRQ